MERTEYSDIPVDGGVGALGVAGLQTPRCLTCPVHTSCDFMLNQTAPLLNLLTSLLESLAPKIRH